MRRQSDRNRSRPQIGSIYINSMLGIVSNVKADRTCKHCEVSFKDVEGKIHANHVRWCVKNTTNGDKGSNAIRKNIVQRMISLKGEIKTFNVVCVKCNSIFQVKEREKLHPQKKEYFCTRTCANSRGKSLERNEKISNTLQAKSNAIHSRLQEIPCSNEACKKIFRQKCLGAKFCSIECGRAYRYRNVDKESLKYYRARASFKFGIASFPGEFDGYLIEAYGWYKPKNRGNNLGGVSRDHMVSVKYGWQNAINPSIIAHPANCRLLRHGENSSKGEANFITIEHLLDRIKIWDEKYKSLHNMGLSFKGRMLHWLCIDEGSIPFRSTQLLTSSR